MNRNTTLPAILVVCSALFLTQCVAPAMLLAPQSQLVWALLKPMVGLDPKEANLFRQPLIQSRLEPLLGSHYAGAVQLLETADKIQQEGPLFYVVSKYTPVPELAEKAGFVWNSETNQMAVLMVSGGAPQIFAEKINSEIAEQVPTWPAELSDYTDPAKLKQQALDRAKQQITDKVPVPAAIAPVADKVEQLKNLKQQTETQIQQTQQTVAAQVLSPVHQVKDQLEQQVGQVKEQAKATVAQPVKAAQQQVQQLQQENETTLQQPIKQLQQQSEQQLQQTKDQVKQLLPSAKPAAVSTEIKNAVLPVTTDQVTGQTTAHEAAKAALTSQVSASNSGADAVATDLKEVTTAAQQQKQSAAAKLSENTSLTEAAAPTQTTNDSAPDDDLAAELAAEQQSLTSSPGLKVLQLQQDIAATSLKLSQTDNAAEALALKHKLQQLQNELKRLTSGK
ncbi:hypothetical protein [Rheinheimera texasensis]|uniref:hypothetical protein n=1 Tax=Rheinheimera texasensis TaxID=306205 RepID=UPI000691856B|nr:hypothetical protein [Rheinheimera texasensis]